MDKPPRLPPPTRGAHLAIARAGSACLGEGQIWDISDKENPRTIARVHNLPHSSPQTQDAFLR